MVTNKQVNIWRGENTPPTIYHVWVKDDNQLLLHNGKEWVIFLDDKKFVEQLLNILERIKAIEKDVEKVKAYKINEKPISTNPILNSEDLNLTSDGQFVKGTDTIQSAMLVLDKLLTTQVI